MNYDYDVVIVGGGAAGLSAASTAIETGARTAIVESNKLGGACTWGGCIPAKALLKSAKVFADTRLLGEYGIVAGRENSYDTAMVMDHVRSIIIKMSTHAETEFYENSGVRVLFGRASFKDRHTLQVNGDTLTSRHFLVCTGSRPRIPAISGLDRLNYLTPRNLFDLFCLPDSVAILGGGLIGIELGQALMLLGVKVSVIETAERILPREDREAAAALEQLLRREGMSIHAGSEAVACAPSGKLAEITLEDKAHRRSSITAERVLVAAGRIPETEGLALENAGVAYTGRGIITDATLKTSADNIYACGDVTGPYRFTHMAGYQAKIAMTNILSGQNREADYSAVPWCAYTRPELAHFGPTEEEARARYGNIHVYRAEYADNDRAIADREDAGFVKVITDDRDAIVAAHILGAGAGEIVHEYILARAAGMTLARMNEAIYLYPTISRLVKETGRQSMTKERLREKEKAAVP